jgi:hypothetical protein
MFRNCTRFNQPLNSWDIDIEVVDVSNMFENCPIEQRNKPGTNIVVDSN